MNIIQIKNLIHEYIRKDEHGEVLDILPAVNDVSLNVKKGDFIAILGHNGSGKSTLAKHINAILKPTKGTVFVNDMDTQNDDLHYNIRQTAGMVFQNPDNQIIGTIVEEDVGFGPENLGVPTDEIWERVANSLETVGMKAYREYSPNKLSGGQKQRIAIAGVLAMKPECIVFDEPTAMLDPIGRKDVINTVKRLNKELNITIILITHNMDEVIDADQVFVMDKGEIKISGTPREIFSHVHEMKAMGLEVPCVTNVAYKLNKLGFNIDYKIIKQEELVSQIVNQCKNNNENIIFENEKNRNVNIENKLKDCIILDNVSKVYNEDTEFAHKALDEINLVINRGEFIGIAGHTGSGKSTLIQHLNGLIKPTSGKVYYNGEDIYGKDYSRKNLRAKVGLVFQFPEHQLFESTVFDDVCYGPSNLDIPKIEAQKRAYDAIEQVGLTDAFYDLSPFELSGGQKKRVAIAGILAMKPDYLILDEPTSSLDPLGRDEILKQIKELHDKEKITIILVSHSMDDLAKYVHRLIVIDEGKIKFDNNPKEVFKNYEELERMGLAAPRITYLMQELKKKGLNVDDTIINVREAVDNIASILR